MLTGDAGANVIDGQDGDDFMVGGGGGDKFVGGLGKDTVSYQDSAYGITADMSKFGLAGTKAGSQFGDAFGDTFDGVENLIGSKYNDVLVGSQDDNVLFGGTGETDTKGDDTPDRRRRQ